MRSKTKSSASRRQWKSRLKMTGIFLLMFGSVSNALNISSILKSQDFKKAPLWTELSANQDPQHLSPYWVCASRSGASFKIICLDLFADPGKEQMGDLQISFSTQNEKHEYGGRRGILMSNCTKMREKIKRMVASSNQFCILGSGAGKDPSKKTYGWVFDEFRTSNEKVSWF